MPSLKDKLLALTDPYSPEGTNLDYRALGLSEESIPELLELLSTYEEVDDDERSEAIEIHLHRALAEVGDPSIEQLFLEKIKLVPFTQDQLFVAEFPDLMRRMGVKMTVPLYQLLEEEEVEFETIAAVEALEKLADDPSLKKEIIASFGNRLKRMGFDRALHAHIIAALINLKSAEHIDLIRALYEANLVDISMNGDLEEVELDLGLRDVRTTEKGNWDELEAKLAMMAKRNELGPPPSEGDTIEVLQYFITLYRTADSLQSVSQIDGLLLGSLLCTEMIPPSALFRQIWIGSEDDDEPVWESRNDAEMFMSALLARHNELVTALANDDLDSEQIILGFDDGVTPLYSEWALGVVLGFMQSEPDNQQAARLGAQIIEKALEIQDLELQEDPSDAPTVQKRVDAFFPLLSKIYALNRNRNQGISNPNLLADPYDTLAPIHREAPKVGRNDPCPCGSGRKYKRCCMN
jgi:uncharacterized protein